MGFRPKGGHRVGQTFKETFWITDRIKEDVFFGMPALRTMSASINIARNSNTDDFLVLRDTNTTVPLSHHAGGVTTDILALSTAKPFTIQPHTGTTQKLLLRPGTDFVWTENTPVTGLIHTAARNGNYAKTVYSVNEIDPETNETTVIIQNDTSHPITYYPGCTVAYIEPMLVKAEKDTEGRAALSRRRWEVSQEDHFL